MIRTVMKILPVVLVIMLSATMFAGCSKSAEPKPVVSVREEIFSKYSDDIDENATLSILSAFAPMTATHGNPLVSGFPLSPTLLAFDTLFDCQLFAENQPFYPQLATGFTYDEATAVLRFTMRDGILWSDGSPVTIKDIYTNICFQQEKSFLWDYIEKVSIVDDKTIEIDFTVANPGILQRALGVYIQVKYDEYKKWADQIIDITQNYREKDPVSGRYRLTNKGRNLYRDMNFSLAQYKPDLTKTVCSGPYTFTSMSNDLIVMTRNDKYWNRQNVHISEVRNHAGMSVEGTTLLIKSGKLDIDGTQVTPEIMTQLKQQFPAMRTLLRRYPIQYGIAFNMTKYPVTIPEVRQAISMAIDRNVLLEVKKPLGTKGDTHGIGLSPMLIESGIYTSQEFINSLPDYDFNPEKAAQLLESIGWKKFNDKWNNEKGESVKLDIMSSGIIMEAEICRDILADFGFDVTYNPADGNVEWSNMEDSKHMLRYGVINSTFLEFPDPWSCYNSLYNFPLNQMRAAYNVKYGTPYLIKDKSGKEHNIDSMIDGLRSAANEDILRERVEVIAKLTNELLPNVSLFEDTEIMRIYDDSIRYELKGFDNVSEISYITDYDAHRNGFIWALKNGKFYKVKKIGS